MHPTAAKVRLSEVVHDDDDTAVGSITNALTVPMIGDDQDTVNTAIQERGRNMDNICFGKDNTEDPNDKEEEEATSEADGTQSYPKYCILNIWTTGWVAIVKMDVKMVPSKGRGC